MASAELAERSETLDRDSLDRVRTETREAADIVRDVMRLVQQPEQADRATHLETTLVELLTHHREELAEHDIAVLLDVQPAVSLVGGKQSDLMSLFSWLLRFAEARLEQVPGPREVKWSAQLLGAGVVVNQVDTGPALPPGYVPWQLDYFRPADPDFLGHVELALVQRVAENCGAGLRVDATPQGRVEVTVTLIPGSLLEAPLRRPRRAAPASGMRVTILVADDDQANREAVRRLLEGEGHRVTVAANGVEALGYLQQADFDVVIVDLQMPRLDGRRLYEHLLDIRPAIARRFVFVTGDDASTGSREFLSRVGQPALPKPYPIADLIAAVNEIAAP